MTLDAHSSPGNAVLVLNSGSSSLKAGLFVARPGANFAGESALLTAEASGIGQGGGRLVVHDGAGHALGKADQALGSQKEALQAIYAAIEEHAGLPQAIGHRVVHGGPHLRQHLRLTPGVMATLRKAVHFAPLHLPASLALMEQAQQLFPGVPQAACFDTAFHQTMPKVATRFAIPDDYVAAGVERYGFHGLSYESIIGQLRTGPERLAERIVLAHLGSGSSLCAVKRGRSVDTTMGFTPTGGIPMATRTGDLDPGVLFFMARTGGLSIDALEELVNHKAGLAAISGGSGDMQQLEAAAKNKATNEATNEAKSASGDEETGAGLAFQIFATAVAKAIASLIIPLAGLDLLVFTGGIGEHSATLRAAVLERLTPLGMRIDPAANVGNERLIGAATSKVPIQVLPAEEDLVIAAHTRRLLLQA